MTPVHEKPPDLRARAGGRLADVTNVRPGRLLPADDRTRCGNCSRARSIPSASFSMAITLVTASRRPRMCRARRKVCKAVPGCPSYIRLTVLNDVPMRCARSFWLSRRERRAVEMSCPSRCKARSTGSGMATCAPERLRSEGGMTISR